MLAFTVAILAFNLFGEGVRRLLEGGKLIVNRLVNRYTVAAAGVAAVVALWLVANSGVMPFYQQQAETFDGESAYRHVAMLAHPALEGRALGTQGLDHASQYIAGQFEGLGLQSAGQDNSYFAQRTRSFARLEAVPTLEIEDGGPPLVYGQDFAVYPGLYQSDGQANGPVRFVGLGQRLNVAGVVWRLVYPELDRADFSGESLLTLSSREAYALNVARKDALFVLVPEPDLLDRRYTLGSRPRSWHHPWLWISQETTDRLLARAGEAVETMEERYAEIAAESVLQVPLDVQATVDVRTVVEGKWPVQHVLGYLPGTHGYDFCYDCLGRQLIVVMAAYDSPPPGPEDRFYPGANDNASGVAVMLEALRVLQETEYQPYKTMMFVAYSREGLEGGEQVSEPDLNRLLRARKGLSNLQPEAIVELRGVGAGSGKRLEIAAGGSQRLARLFESAARRVGVRTVRAQETMDLSAIYGDSGSAGQGGSDTPKVRVFWEGWEETSRRPGDTVESVTPAKLEQAGQTLALALMVLGRETEY
jgi:hypothetical protein